MKKLNKTTDTQKYLLAGALTQPFLPKIEFELKILQLVNQKLNSGEYFTTIDAVLSCIHNQIKQTTENQQKLKFKFNRTAQEIWQSGFATGCTDYALVFCCLMRLLKVPTTFVAAAGQNYVNQLKSGNPPQMHYGHTFCECYCSYGKVESQKSWVLVDPTACKVVLNHSTNKNIVLPYTIGSNSTFVPYFRDLDFGSKTTIEDWNKRMDNILKINNIN